MSYLKFEKVMIHVIILCPTVSSIIITFEIQFEIISRDKTVDCNKTPLL